MHSRRKTSDITIKGLPNGRIAREIFDPSRKLEFRYEHSEHDERPHVLKFSGGRSSGMMLIKLLESGLLKAERGDVIVFNNTSAEHPKTYEFVRRCKEWVQNCSDIPFFWLEFQSYEDARQGEWTRLPSYRLVKAEPKELCPDGYHWRGEVFEELLSLTGFVPNQFQRICTSILKIATTRAFLCDWFASQPSTKRMGHFYKSSKIDDEEYYEGHLRNRGGVPKEIFLRKKAFVRSRPVCRPAQSFADYSSAYRPFRSPYLAEKRYGGKVRLGKGKAEYLSFIGLRADEPRRVHRVRSRERCSGSVGPEASSYEGEHAYMPLSDWKITLPDVENFWRKQSFDLELESPSLSNCTFCFLKGIRNLQTVRNALSPCPPDRKGTPSDLAWWIDLEGKYGRDLKAEERTIRSEGMTFIGFFGTQSDMGYEKLRDNNDLGHYENEFLPCDCTD